MPFDIATWLEQYRGEATLLGICPMTEEIVRAAIATAAARSFVPMFVATPRQVDGPRGYTGWSQSELVAFIDAVRSDVGHEGPYVLARDHGGPYQSFRDRGDPSVPPDEAMRYARDLFEADLAAGFDVLHVDATADPRVDEPLPLETVIERTVTLIERIEAARAAHEGRPVRYEIGTEEVSGGMTDPADFERFICELRSRVRDRRLDIFDRIVFTVGQVGTTMRIDMTNDFDADRARRLVQITADLDVSLKVHYTDWLADETLAMFPAIGVGAANVGPEFAGAIVDALFDLEEREREALSETGSPADPSGFGETIMGRAVADAPWQKFAPDDLPAEAYDQFAAANRRNIATCVGRYVLTDPAVEAARARLYENLRTHTDTDPEGVVLERVQRAIDRYVDQFNLAGTGG